MNRNLLIYEMNERGFTVTSLARAIGISKSALSKKMNGHSEFTLGEIQRICDALRLESPTPIFFNQKVS